MDLEIDKSVDADISFGDTFCGGIGGFLKF